MENLCRTCLRMPSNLLPLFDDARLPDKIATISDIEVHPNDNLPSKICTECITNINQSYNFRKVIRNSDIELRERFAALSQSSDSNHELAIKLESTIETMLEVKDEVEIIETSFEENLMEDFNKQKVEENRIATEENIKIVEENRGAKKDSQKTLDVLKGNYSFKNMIIWHKKTYKCNICNFTSRESSEMFNHKRTQHYPRGICSICGKSMRAENLHKHIKNHSALPVTCTECGKVFKNPESLRTHILTHSGPELICELCGRTFKYRGEYNRHKKRRHSLNGEKTKKCPICGKIIKRDLKKHMQTHTGEKPYPCQFCEKSFSSSYARKTHTRQHTNEKPFICEYCPMAFTQKVSLMTHIKSKHSKTVFPSDNLPFKICPECIININLSYNFRRVIRNSDIKLQKCLAVLSEPLNSGYESKINLTTSVETTTQIRNEVEEIQTSLEIEDMKIEDLDIQEVAEDDTKAAKYSHKKEIEMSSYVADRKIEVPVRKQKILQKVPETNTKAAKGSRKKEKIARPSDVADRNIEGLGLNNAAENNRKFSKGSQENKNETPLDVNDMEVEDTDKQKAAEYNTKAAKESQKILQINTKQKRNVEKNLSRTTKDKFWGNAYQDLSWLKTYACNTLDVKDMEVEDTGKQKAAEYNTKAAKDSQKILQINTKQKRNVEKNLSRTTKDKFWGNAYQDLSWLKTYACNTCNLTGFTSTQLKYHRLSVHNRYGICNICGKSVTNYNLSKHIKSHSEPEVTCPICGKLFRNTESLRSHKLVHNQRKLICELCGKTFRFTSEYNRHRKEKHSPYGLKTEKCHICEKTFSKKRFKDHLRTHTGERPYSCQYCGKRFTSSHAKKVHVRQHTNEKPYKCAHCSMAYPQKVSLITHLKSKHSAA